MKLLAGVLGSMLLACLPPPATNAGLTDVSYRGLKRVPPEQIPLYRTQIPDVPFVERGVVVVSAGRSPEMYTSMMRQQASELGGDAVIDVDATFFGLIGTVVEFTAEPTP